jgi:hypothetical protein
MTTTIDDSKEILNNNIIEHNICKFYVKKICNHGNNCKFIHEDNICRNYFFDGVCNKNEKCKFNHKYKLNTKQNLECCTFIFISTSTC